VNYDTKEVVTLLDAPTISALFKIYDIGYKQVALRFRYSKANVTYKMKTDSWYLHERQMLLELFQQHGMEIVELMLINQMTNKAKKLKKDVKL
jgi:hypothetical protein